MQLPPLRILHTADWHLGISLEQHRRYAEQEAFIEEIARLAEDCKVHIVLIAGDVFDNENPPALAEEYYCRALSLLARNGRKVVVIAGNHDHPGRLAAVAPLAEKSGIHIIGQAPENPQTGERSWRPEFFSLYLNGPNWPHPAMVLALPYPSEARLKNALASPSLFSASPAASDREEQLTYAEGVARLWAQLSAFCRPQAVNLAVSHLFVFGSRTSDSERLLSVGGAFGVGADVFPPGLQYIALGHLHRPQAVPGAPAPCRYSGSPLAYSFSEAGQAKGVVLVEAEPGRPARTEEIYLSAGRPLVRWRATEGYAQALAWCREGRDADAWIDLEIITPTPPTREEEERLRELRPHLIRLQVTVAGADAAGRENHREPDYVLLPLEDLFRHFYRQQTGGEPDPELVRLFLELAGDGESPEDQES